MKVCQETYLLSVLREMQVLINNIFKLLFRAIDSENVNWELFSFADESTLKQMFIWKATMLII